MTPGDDLPVPCGCQPGIHPGETLLTSMVSLTGLFERYVMNGKTAKKLRLLAHKQAPEHIGRPHYTTMFMGQIIRAVFGKIVRDEDGNEQIAFPKTDYGGTIQTDGTRRVYKDLKRRFKQARTPTEKRTILVEETL